MKKFSFLSSAALIALSLSGQAQAAGTAAQTFTVTASLTTACASANTAPAAVSFGAYTSFGAATNPAPTTAITFKCTRSATAVPTGVALTGGTAGSSAGTYTILGLDYTLAVGAAVKTAGTSPNPDIYSYTVTGGMASGQAGDTAGTASPVTHTLTITY